MNKVSGKKKKKKKDINEIMYYKCHKKNTTWTNIQNFGGQKTAIGLGDLYVDDWSKKKRFGTYLLYPLSSLIQEKHYRSLSSDQFRK